MWIARSDYDNLLDVIDRFDRVTQEQQDFIREQMKLIDLVARLLKRMGIIQTPAEATDSAATLEETPEPPTVSSTRHHRSFDALTRDKRKR